MTSAKNNAENDQVKNGIYFLLTAIAAVPVFMAINTYLKAIGTHEDEALATAGTIVFIGSVFIGRHLATIWSAKKKEIPDQLLTILLGIVIFCTIALFIHADFKRDRYPALNLLAYWLLFLTIGLSTGALIKLFRLRTRKQLEEAQTQAAHSQSELHLLQSQLSPHFLFNTLNNMYGLSITQHEKIPALLLKLSDLLRYSVYEANEIFVPLKDELAYIHNYIDFEKLRIGDRLELKTDIENIDNTAIRIAPMLLIVFIENAFKHSKNTADHRIFIEISLKTWGNSILFYLKNSHDRNASEDKTVVRHSGFGLANVNKRLQLLYPGQHDLSIENEETSYAVNLRLTIR